MRHSNIELLRRLRFNHNMFQEFDRPKIEVDLKSILVLRDIGGSLEAAVEDERVAIQSEHRAKSIEPGSIRKKGLDIREDQYDVVSDAARIT